MCDRRPRAFSVSKDSIRALEGRHTDKYEDPSTLRVHVLRRRTLARIHATHIHSCVRVPERAGIPATDRTASAVERPASGGSNAALAG